MAEENRPFVGFAGLVNNVILNTSWASRGENIYANEWDVVDMHMRSASCCGLRPIM
jgi:hypothetical protein